MSYGTTTLQCMETAVEVGLTAADVMVTVPKTHPVDASVAQVRAAFADDHVHMVLLVSDGVLHGTVRRTDLPPAPPDGPALRFATLVGRTVAPDEPAEALRLRLVAAGQRRLAVVGARHALLGLVCLKRSGTGFCTDEGVAARAREQAAIAAC